MQITPPRKIKIPLLLQIALVFWAVSAFSYWIFQDFDLGGSATVVCITLVGFLVLILVVFILSKNVSLLFVISVLCALLCSFLCATTLKNNQEIVGNLGSQTCQFKVLSDQTIGTTTNSANAEIINIKNNELAPGTKIKLQFNQDSEEIHAGDIIQTTTNFSAAYETQAQNYWQNGISGTARLTFFEKTEDNSITGNIYKFRNSIIECLRTLDSEKSTSEQLLSAIVCGQRIDLSTSTLYDAFRNCGLAHLVAVSGAHLSLVTAVLLLILKKLKVNKRLSIILQSMFIFAYLICAAVPISAVRAAFMAYVALFAFFSKRRPAPLNAIGLCIIILISIDPTTSLSISFALSAGSTIGIILFSGLIEYWILKSFKKCPEFISSALSLTFAASICSQPLSICIFNQFPLIAPIANIIATPLFSVLCAGGLLVTIVCNIIITILPSLASFLYFLISLLANVMCKIVYFLSDLPYACIPATINIYIALILTMALCFLLYKLWPDNCSDNVVQKLFEGKHYSVYEGSLKPGKSSDIFMPVKSYDCKLKEHALPSRLLISAKHYLVMEKNKTKRNIIIILILLAITALIAGVLLFLINRVSENQIVMLDVGQGDSILIKSGGKTVMVDTGNKDNLLKQRLAEQGITHLDGLFITHPDDDHCGSIDVLQNMVVVDNFYYAADLDVSNSTNSQKLKENASKLTNNKHPLKVGDKVEFGNVELTTIWPDKFSDDGGNADSLTLLAEFDVNSDSITDATALLCGDAEKDQIDQMIQKGRLNKVDVYKVGHHGSKNAINNNAAKIISPDISIISVGENNRYGHPAQSTLNQLSNSKIYRTDTQGTLILNIFRNSIQVKTERNS